MDMQYQNIDNISSVNASSVMASTMYTSSLDITGQINFIGPVVIMHNGATIDTIDNLISNRNRNPTHNDIELLRSDLMREIREISLDLEATKLEIIKLKKWSEV